jgi:hypothetical protein
MPTQLVQHGTSYPTWVQLPNRAHVGDVPDRAGELWQQYEQRHARWLILLRELADVQDYSAAWMEAERADRQAALAAMRRGGEEVPAPVHKPELLARRAQLQLERDTLPVHANEVLAALHRSLLDAQPDMLREAFAVMNARLTDKRATARERLDAVARVAWIAGLGDELAWPSLAGYDDIERAEQLIATLPSETARHIVERMDPELRALLADDEHRRTA